MRLRTVPLAVACILALGPRPGFADAAHETAAAADYDAHLGALFEHFHANPELSFVEVETAARLARELEAAGAEVTTGVGGTGVVGLLENGDGPLVLVRADMDGLPLREQTGLPYASTATQISVDGASKPVMHACGHDVHMTAMVGTARRLATLRDAWSGTVMFIGQPAEERIGGAKAMLEDGLYARFGVPDHALALHVMAGMPAGRIAIVSGATASYADSVDIVVRGAATHGASPQKGKDAVYIAAQTVVALQSLVSRELNPLDPGVVTVGAIRGGLKHNIVAGEVKLELTVRADSRRVRDQLIAGIERIARGVATTHGVADDALPSVTVIESTPGNVNDAELVERVRRAFVGEFGEDVFWESERDGMGAEDFAYFVETEDDVPGAYFAVGGTPADVVAAGESPSHHSPFFQVEPAPSIQTGVRAMTAAVLELLGR